MSAEAVIMRTVEPPEGYAVHDDAVIPVMVIHPGHEELESGVTNVQPEIPELIRTRTVSVPCVEEVVVPVIVIGYAFVPVVAIVPVAVTLALESEPTAYAGLANTTIAINKVAKNPVFLIFFNVDEPSSPRFTREYESPNKVGINSSRSLKILAFTEFA